MAKLIAYDLGTGGIKASLHSESGETEAEAFIEYPTCYPKPQWHEQRPMDWWDAVCQSTQMLLEQTGVKNTDIAAVALSGHSLVVAPLGEGGELLLQQVPIWSDTRAESVLDPFFEKIPYEQWYSTTGNGDPPACYSIFKLMWMREHQPEVFAKTKKVLGSKDFVNYMLTGEIATDPSYASGSGAFDLKAWGFKQEFFDAAGIPATLFPAIVPSHAIVGKVTKAAEAATGLAEGTPVACGGVDNSCMALGALGIEEGRAYVSLGSSSWIAVDVKEPLIDTQFLPFTFAHIEEGYYTSAMSIFAAGGAYKWVKNQLCRDIAADDDALIQMDKWAKQVPIGSNGVLFGPSLAGGSAQEKSPYIQGAFLGLTLGTTREDMVRATLEGVTMNLRLLMDEIEKQARIRSDVLLCGGGSKSPLWRQMFADIFGKTIEKTNVDQDAAALGAAGIAARGCGLWADYSPIKKVHRVEHVARPVPENVKLYEKQLTFFNHARNFLSEFGDEMHENG